MVVEGALKVFLVGCLGGLLNELLHWWNLREQLEFPQYVRSAIYWVLTVLMIFVGGLIVWFYFGEKVEAIVAIHIGLSAPLILQKMITSIPSATGARGRGTSVRSFFSW